MDYVLLYFCWLISLLLIFPSVELYWAISFWFAEIIIWAWAEFFHLSEKNSRDKPSNMIEIHIQIHTKFAIVADDIAVAMANITKIIPSVDIHHRNGIVSLFCIQKNINIPPLISARKANSQTINLPTKLASLDHIRTNPSIKTKIPITNRKEIYEVSLFFIEFIIAEIPENINAIHNKMFIQLQNPHGLKTVRNPQIIKTTATHSNSQEDRPFIEHIISKLNTNYIIIFLKKSNISSYCFLLAINPKVFTMNHWWKIRFLFSLTLKICDDNIRNDGFNTSILER